jgi:PIN domain
MKLNYVLIDYENVQPKDLSLLKDGAFKIKVFLGPNQTRIPIALATSLHALGERAEYILLDTSGANALDFHIAYFIGVLSSQDPAGFFHIISKDTGFDPLMKYLKKKGIHSQRSASIGDMPCFKPVQPAKPTPPVKTAAPKTAALTGDAARIDMVVKDLIKRKTAKPRTQKTLLSTLHALFKKELTEPQLASLFAALCKKGVVIVDGAKVSYNLPD